MDIHSLGVPWDFDVESVAPSISLYFSPLLSVMFINLFESARMPECWAFQRWSIWRAPVPLGDSSSFRVGILSHVGSIVKPEIRYLLMRPSSPRTPLSVGRVDLFLILFTIVWECDRILSLSFSSLFERISRWLLLLRSSCWNSRVY